jgi:transcriptional regulator with XRE-family HTH domain
VNRSSPLLGTHKRELMANVGESMQRKRKAKGLSAKEVASRLNVAESTYREWENGRKIQGEPYTEISKVLDINIGFLLGIEKNELVQLQTEIDILEGHVKTIRSHELLLV